MASLVLGAAGAAVGNFLLPGIGGQFGWMIGSAVGNMLTQKSQNGPRVSDLKLQGSAYGAMIPFLYGTGRVGGQIIWQTDLKEHAQKTGGKGGPTVTTYTYSASFAIDLCQGPILGVLKIWADSRLVYDVNITEPTAFPFTLYVGDETQLPDPTIEAVEGVGNTPANRGVAYIVFTDMFLTDYSNRIPNLTFEVFTATDTIPWRYSTFDPANNESRAGPAGEGPQSGTVEGGRLILSTMSGHAQPATFSVDAYDLNGVFIENLSANVMTAPTDCDGNGPAYQCINNPHTAYTVGTPNGFGGHNVSAFYFDGNISAMPITIPGGASSVLGNYNALASLPTYWDGAVYGCGGGPGSAPWVSKWAAPGGAVTSGVPVLSFNLPGTDGGERWSVAADTVTGNIWVAWEGATVPGFDTLYKLDSDLNLIFSWSPPDYPPNFAGYTNGWTVWNDIFYFTGAPTSSFSYAFYVNDDYTFTQAVTGVVQTSGAPLGAFCSNSISLGAGLILTGHGIISLQPRPGGILLSEIVADLSHKSGLVDSQIDVSQLTDIVDGYTIANQAPTRAMIEPLQVSYFFDAVESDTVAKFVKRGAAPAVVIPIADLGTFVSGSTPPALATVLRAQEVDLPQFISAVFIDNTASYQNGERHSNRQITESEIAISMQLPISMDSVKAKQVTDVNLWDAWIGRDRVTLLTPRKYAYLEPTDVVGANGYTLRIREKEETVPGIIKLDGVTTATYVYTQASVPGPGLAPPPPPPPVPMSTDALLLDLPLVNDTDNPYGWYAAMNGASSGTWPGGSLFKSIDGGATFTEEIADVVPDTFGDCLSVLGDFGGGNIFDETNSLTVQVTIGSGTLSGATRLAVLNGANRCAVGTVGTTGIRQIELLQFRDAALIGTRTYLLSGFLRGRRGTEWMIGQHTTPEKFVLLPTSTNVLGAPGEIYLPRKYRAVTAGRTLATASDIDFTDFAMANLCYSPTCLGGGRFPNQDIYLQWRRRTRIGGGWLDAVDVPLSEAIELYGVKIYSDNTYTTVLATISTGTQSLLYTAAEQTTDFGSPQAVLYWGVVQQGAFNVGTESRAVT